MRSFLRPDAARLILLLLLLGVAFLGSREAAAFSDDGKGASSGAWTIWMILLAPLGLLLLVSEAAQRVVFHGSPVVFWIVQVVYFYLVACVVVWAAGALRRR